jgi:hypothetical protein
MRAYLERVSLQSDSFRRVSGMNTRVRRTDQALHIGSVNPVTTLIQTLKIQTQATSGGNGNKLVMLAHSPPWYMLWKRTELASAL